MHTCMLAVSLYQLYYIHPGCLRNEITILSTNTTLLPLNSITALQADRPKYPVEDIVSRGPGKFWCTTGDGVNYVNMTFSQPVVVESIFHVGATSMMSTVEHYVSSFSMFYSPTENGPLQLYPTVRTLLIFHLHVVYTCIILSFCTEFHGNVSWLCI